MEAEIPAIEREAQQALDQVSRVLPPQKHTLSVMYVAGTDEGFSAVTGRSGANFLGIALSRFEVRAGGIEINNRVFFINGAAFRTDPTQDRQRTIAHELTHLLLSDSTMPYTPAWVSEGAAMYATDDFPLETIAQWYHEQGPDTVDLATLSRQTSFGGHAGATVEQTSIEYAYSAFLAKYLIDTYGNDRFFEFYDSFADVPVEELRAQLETDTGFEAAMSAFAPQVAGQKVQAIYGIDLATLERNYEAWLADQLEG
jgi:hypothetical protein